MIVDAHVHVLSEDQVRYPRTLLPHGSEWVERMPVTTELLLAEMDEAGIDKTVIVQAFGAYAYDNGYALDSAREHAARAVGVCIVDFLASDAADRLVYWVEQRGARGVRFFPREDARLDDPRAGAVWERATALGIPVCAFTPFAGVPALAGMAERHPDLPVALDHVGAPDLSEGPPYESAAPLFELARLPNVHLKFSSMTIAAASQGKSTPAEFFPRLVERFGTRRLIWGSNFPATHDRPLKAQYEMAREVMAFLPEEDARWAFGETAAGLWPALREAGR